MILMIGDRKQKIFRVIIVIILIIIIGGIYQLKNINSSRYANTSSPTINKSILRLVNYGSKPCKCQPKPAIYEELEKKYQGKVFFEYVDILAAAKVGIKKFPTQVIYDANFKELARNEGNINEEDIKKLIESVIAK